MILEYWQKLKTDVLFLLRFPFISYASHFCDFKHRHLLPSFVTSELNVFLIDLFCVYFQETEKTLDIFNITLARQQAEVEVSVLSAHGVYWI